jgi:hypothetical protein
MEEQLEERNVGVVNSSEPSPSPSHDRSKNSGRDEFRCNQMFIGELLPPSIESFSSRGSTSTGRLGRGVWEANYSHV